jgi:hypothetical protein
MGQPASLAHGLLSHLLRFGDCSGTACDFLGQAVNGLYVL